MSAHIRDASYAVRTTRLQQIHRCRSPYLPGRNLAAQDHVFHHTRLFTTTSYHRYKAAVINRSIVGSTTVASRQIDHQDKDVVPSDLAATLEAHRNSNQARGNSRINPTRNRNRLNLQQKQSCCRASDALPNATDIVHQRPTSIHVAERSAARRLKRYVELPVWVTEGISGARDGRERLGMQMQNIESTISLKPVHVTFRETLVDYISSILERELGTVRLHPIGSLYNGFATNLSDVDVGISPYATATSTPASETAEVDSKEPPSAVIKGAHGTSVMMLRKAMWVLKKTGMFTASTLRFSRYDVLALRHASGINIELVAENSQLDAIALIRDYDSQFPQLKPCFYTLKSFLASKALHSQFLRGINSYALIIMLISSFKFKLVSRTTSNIDALMGFLSFWSDFDHKTSFISVEPAKVIAKVLDPDTHTSEDSTSRALRKLCDDNKQFQKSLCIQDPNQPRHNVTWLCDRPEELFYMFRSARRSLARFLAGEKGVDEHPLLPIVGNYPSKEWWARRRLDRWIREQRQLGTDETPQSKHHAALIAEYDSRISRKPYDGEQSSD